MSIAEWYNSAPMQASRLRMLGDSRWEFCNRCYHEETLATTSRRCRSNQKSAIFVENFYQSFEQSPGYKKFTEPYGVYQGMPIDIHVNLGNYCNLACKICSPVASSKIFNQYQKWNIVELTPQDWTQDRTVWDRFLQEIISIPKLQNIHFMGGETLIQPKFEEFIDFLLDNNRTDICISFVTNGTVFNYNLLQKLKKFSRLGLELSIETLSASNNYIRQGTDTSVVLKNINNYIQECNGTNITLTLRPAPSALSIRDFWQVIKLALDKRLIIKSNMCTDPEFLDITVLPLEIRQQYKQSYLNLLSDYNLNTITDIKDYNESDAENYQLVAKNQIITALSSLDSCNIKHQDKLLAEFCQHLSRWDKVYGYDAKEIYPELTEIFKQYFYDL